jgi:hypothetical protein
MRSWIPPIALLVSLAAPSGAAGQGLPDRPVELAGGAIRVTGDVSATIGPRDENAFFNYTDYEHNALRMFRLSLTGAWRPTDRFAVLTEVRSEDVDGIQPYALYVRVRPSKAIPLDIQAGRIPPVFGAFARRSYGSDNPLIGYPLAYQYLTSLRPDAIPASADDLLAMRARGWLASYPVGSPAAAPGSPLVSAYRWDTGVEAHLDTQHVEAGVAVTAGTLSRPRVRDDNDGRQFSGRVAWKPIVGLVLGASAARGEWLNGSLKKGLVPYASGDYPQTAFGLDGEYSRDHWIVRSELIVSRWTLPSLSEPSITGPLRATSGFVESRYRFTPRFFAAARVDGLTFSRIAGRRLFDGVATPWDAPVTRIEAGGGVYLERNITLRGVLQRDWRDAGRVHNRTYASAQISYWF